LFWWAAARITGTSGKLAAVVSVQKNLATTHHLNFRRMILDAAIPCQLNNISECVDD